MTGLLARLIGYKSTRKLEIILFKWLDTKCDPTWQDCWQDWLVIKAQENPRLFLSSGWTQNIITKCDPMRLLAALIGYKSTRKPEIILFKWLDTKYNHKQGLIGDKTTCKRSSPPTRSKTSRFLLMVPWNQPNQHIINAKHNLHLILNYCVLFSKYRKNLQTIV